MSLLNALIQIKKSDFSLFVITVNHNIRPEQESKNDVDCVTFFCKKNNIDCTVAELLPNQAAECAAKRKRGIEDAARFLRYQAFERFIQEKKLDVLCLGHTQNDVLETLLQRFLQGSFGISLLGIQKKRGAFFRPLININRYDVMSYIQKNNIPYCIDSTNAHNNYLRNKIRNVLIPVLNQHFDGWQTALLHGAQKNAEDSAFIESNLKSVFWKTTEQNQLIIDSELFLSLPDALKIRLFYDAAKKLACEERIPFAFFKTFLEKKQKKISGYGIDIFIDEKSVEKNIIVQKETEQKESGFFLVINECKPVAFSHFFADIYNDQKSVSELFLTQKNTLGPFLLPLVIRSYSENDTLITESGTKKISALFAEWKIPPHLRCRIPIIESQGIITCVCADFLGFANRYAKKIKEKNGTVFVRFNRKN